MIYLGMVLRGICAIPYILLMGSTCILYTTAAISIVHLEQL